MYGSAESFVGGADRRRAGLMTVEDRIPSPIEADVAHEPRASEKLLTLGTIAAKASFWQQFRRCSFG